MQVECPLPIQASRLLRHRLLHFGDEIRLNQAWKPALQRCLSQNYSKGDTHWLNAPLKSEKQPIRQNQNRPADATNPLKMSGHRVPLAFAIRYVNAAIPIAIPLAREVRSESPVGAKSRWFCPDAVKHLHPKKGHEERPDPAR